MGRRSSGRLARIAAVLAVLAVACGDASAERDVQPVGAASDVSEPSSEKSAHLTGVVAVQGAEGLAIGGEVLPDARLIDDGSVAVVASSDGGRTEVRWLVTTDGSVLAAVTVTGSFEIAAIDVPGRFVALVPEAGAAASDEIAPARDHTEVVVVDREGERFRRSYEGNIAPEGFASWFAEGASVPGLAFVLEYSPPDHPTHYRVRTLDLVTGELGLPLSLRDKSQTVDQLMAGVSRTQLLAARDGLLFTLYRGHHDEGHGSYAFIHTLGLANGVWCLVVPDEMRLADSSGALALDPTGERLVAVSANGTIASIPLVNVVELTRSPDFDAPTDLGATTDGAPSIATGATSLWIGLGRTLLRVDPASFAVLASAEMPVVIDAVAEQSDGTVVVGGEGRLLGLSADLTVVTETSVPNGVGSLRRIATL